MLDKIKFMELLKDLTTIARIQDDPLTKEEIKEYFKGMELEDEHYNHIYTYLEEDKKKGDVSFSETEKKEGKEGKEELKEVDSIYLKMYLKELKILKSYTNEELEILYKEAGNGKKEAKEQLVYGWLPQVVTLAKQYKNRGILLEDLIQEGNVGLLSALDSLLEIKEKINIGEYIKRYISNTLEERISESCFRDDLEHTILGKTNLLNEASKYLAEDLGRVATIEELAEYTKLSQQEIKDMIALSLSGIKTGKGE